jgi:hypothetical protein
MGCLLCAALLTVGKEAPAELAKPARTMIARAASNAVKCNSHFLLFTVLSFLLLKLIPIG